MRLKKAREKEMKRATAWMMGGLGERDKAREV